MSIDRLCGQIKAALWFLYELKVHKRVASIACEGELSFPLLAASQIKREDRKVIKNNRFKVHAEMQGPFLMPGKRLDYAKTAKKFAKTAKKWQKKQDKIKP